MILEIEVAYYDEPNWEIERDYFNESHPTEGEYNHTVSQSGGVWEIYDGTSVLATSSAKFGEYENSPGVDENFRFTVRIACFGDSRPSSGKIPRPSTPMSVEKELKLAEIARSVDARHFGRASWRTLLTGIANGTVRCVKVDR